MKDAFLLYILLILCCLSCTDDAGVPPSISVDSIYVNNERWDLNDDNEITQESIVKVFATLFDNEGSGLVSFNVKSLWLELPVPPSYIDEMATEVANNGTGEEVVLVEIVERSEDHLSEGLPSDSANLRFRDDVRKTNVVMEAKFISPVDMRGELVLQMYLNIKDAGISEDLVFKVID